MANMRAAVLTGTRKIEITEVPVPEPGEGWVRVRVEVCGICGSDLRYFHGENPWSLHTLGYQKALPPRMVLGHEIAGVISAVGRGVDQARIGERVVALCFRVCGTCPACRSGNEHLCPNTQHLGHGAGFEDWELNPGGYADECLVWASQAVPLPASVSFEDAVFLDGLGVAVHSVRHAGVKKGSSVLMLGCGPIGLLCAEVASAWGASTIICADTNATARRHAKRLVPARVLDPGDEDITAVVLDATRGYGVDAILDTTGSIVAQHSGVRALAPGGTIVYLAGPAPGLALDLRALAGERTHTTSANFRLSEFPEALDLLASGRVRVDGLVTHRFPLMRAADALATVDRKDQTGAFKVVIVPG